MDAKADQLTGDGDGGAPVATAIALEVSLAQQQPADVSIRRNQRDPNRTAHVQLDEAARVVGKEREDICRRAYGTPGHDASEPRGRDRDGRLIGALDGQSTVDGPQERAWCRDQQDRQGVRVRRGSVTATESGFWGRCHAPSEFGPMRN
jgi:hypothetical protein